jgi:hypothetical protein
LGGKDGVGVDDYFTFFVGGEDFEGLVDLVLEEKVDALIF